MSRRLCALCKERRALYIRRRPRAVGRASIVIRADSDHDLCLRCYRSERSRQQARALAACA